MINEYKESMKAKVNVLLLRSLLIKYNSYEIVDMLNDVSSYKKFIKEIDFMMDFDKDFLLIRDYLVKIQLVLRLGSFKFNSKDKLRKTENEHIIDLNRLSMIDNRNVIVDSYLGGEMEMRSYLTYNDELLFNSMGNDFYVAKVLQDTLNGESNLKEVNNNQLIESSSYFMYIVPEIYYIYPESIDLISNRLQEIKKEQPKIKLYADSVIKNLARMK